MFIAILEGLHPLEAEIVCLIKDKKLSAMSFIKCIISITFILTGAPRENRTPVLGLQNRCSTI